MEKKTRGAGKKDREQQVVKIIDHVLDAFEKQWSDKAANKKEISPADALRLIELRKKIAPQEAREVIVRWVDAESKSTGQ